MNFIDMPSNLLLAIFYIWGNAVCILIMLILFLKNYKNKQTASYYLINVIFFLIIYFLGDSLWALAYFSIIPNGDVLLKISRIMYYLSSAIVAYSWYIYVEILIGSKFVYTKKRKFLLIPVLLSFISTILICLFLDPARKDVFGYLTAFALIVVPFGYIITAGIRLLYKTTKTKDKGTKKKLYMLGIWPIVILVISILQVIFAEIPIFCFGAIIVITSLYIYSQDALIFIDQLTGVNNRNGFKKYTQDLSKDETYYILITDIDKFKSINDTYGHLEGDRALKFTADVLKVVGSINSSFVFRYGGDEFILLTKTNDEDYITNIINLITEKMKKSKDELDYEITTSIGYSIIDDIDNIDDALEKADKMLYEKKEIAHKNR